MREPFGTVLMPLLTFMLMGFTMGWASAPYDPLWEDRHPKRSALMALVGPLANLLLAAIAFVLLKIGVGAGIWWPFEASIEGLVRPVEGVQGIWAPLGLFLSVTLGLNVLLFIFNLIPVPPLDGASVLAGWFEPARRMRDQLRASGFGGMIGIVAAWLIIGRIWNPLLYWVGSQLFP